VEERGKKKTMIEREVRDEWDRKREVREEKKSLSESTLG
jgi:hypothetical protein